MIKNKFIGKCTRCGSKSERLVTADGFNDAPASFTVTETCAGTCAKVYTPMTAEEMHAITRLPLSGWSETEF